MRSLLLLVFAVSGERAGVYVSRIRPDSVDGLSSDHSAGRRAGRGRSAVSDRAGVQASRLVDALRIDRRAHRHDRAGRARMARRCARPGSAAAGALAAPRAGDASKGHAHRRPRQAIHSLGQGRHPESHRSVRAARFSRSDRRRVSRGHRGSRAVRARTALHRRRLGPDVYAEPHAADRRTMGAAAAADVRPDRVRRPRPRVSGSLAVRRPVECARPRVRVLSFVLRRLQPPSAVHGDSALEPAARRASAHLRAAAHGRRGRGCSAPLVYGEGRNRVALHDER